MALGMRAVLVLALSVTGLVSGCGNRSALCLETEIALNDTFMRCIPGTPYQPIVFEDRQDVAACPYVNNTVNESEITHQCLPWLAEVSCAEFLSMGDLPDFCSGDHFVYRYIEPLPEP